MTSASSTGESPLAPSVAAVFAFAEKSRDSTNTHNQESNASHSRTPLLSQPPVPLLPSPQMSTQSMFTSALHCLRILTYVIRAEKRSKFTRIIKFLFTVPH